MALGVYLTWLHWCWGLLSLLAYLVATVTSSSHSASFYGDSYLRVPLDDAGSETDIKLEFQTYRRDGLLFMAAGITDYCVIELRDGQIIAHFELGSGEAMLGSPPGVVFNNMQWHRVQLTRTQAHVQLLVDRIYSSTTTTPGQFYELNINKGVYLGGVQSFSDVFFGHLKSFRGCMRNVLFQSQNLLYQAQEQENPLLRYSVTWDCTTEFGATSDQPITYMHNKSFIAFPPLTTSPSGTLISFNIRTRSENALLLYNSGRLHSSDFLAAEIVSGEIHLSINKGNGVLKVESKKIVNDGGWHAVELRIQPTELRVSVDGRKKERRTSLGENVLLNLYSHLYVGGLGVQGRSLAIEKGLASLRGANAAAGSLIGCMQDFKVNGALLGFREAEETWGLQPECLWTYPCISSPCIDGARCVEKGYYYYDCECNSRSCFKMGATGNSTSVAVMEVVHLQDLVVREGGRSLVTQTNIDVLLDYQSEGLRDSAVVFHLVNNPKHGELTIDITSRSNNDNQLFTQLDLKRNKVTYVHDGSETRSDSLGLELEFLGVDDDMPANYRRTYGFTLMIHVVQWNDKPEVMLPAENTLVIVANTQMKITPKIMDVIDKDDPPRNLEYTIRYGQGFDIGYFEISEPLAVRAKITSFTQEHINEGKIKFTHRGELDQTIELQVSDGKDSSDLLMLNINAVPLRLEMLTNTGLEMAAGVTRLILRTNLAFGTNAPNQNIDVRYEITDPPYYGDVQRQQYPSNQWLTATVFTQEDIDNSRIRYIHNGVYHHRGDYFLFKTKSLDVETDEFEFEIDIMQTEVKLVTNSSLILDGAKEQALSQQNLYATSTIGNHTTSDIRYHLITVPQEGDLEKTSTIKVPGRMSQSEILRKGSNFTQEDLIAGRIIYNLHRALFVAVHDEFQFRLVIPGNSSQVLSFKIEYKPIDTDLQFLNNGLRDVMEGEGKPVTTEDLYMETERIKNFRYTITAYPQHGEIQFVNPAKHQILASNVSSFTNADIQTQKVFYRHDDSESEHDSFTFVATPIIADPDINVREISEFSGTFEVTIVLKNDNPPVRTVDKVFHVIANGGRVITTDDINFIDPDIDYDSDRLLYQCRTMSNGEIVDAADHNIKVKQFRQKELEEGKLYFKHRGSSTGSIVISVRDTQYITENVLEIRASDPFINIVKNTGLSVEKGQSVPLTLSNFSVETNMDVKEKDIKIQIIVPPSYGQLLKSGVDKSRFNLADIHKEQVVYQHDNSAHLRDLFGFLVRIDELEATGDVQIQMVTSQSKHSLHIVSNIVKTINKENKKSIITQNDLEVTHPDTAPRDVQYMIKKHTEAGILSLRGGDEGDKLRTFSQEDINRGKLRYIHRQYGDDTDTFTFDVTNGISSLQGLEFVLEMIPVIIPIDIPLMLPVIEGERRKLDRDVFRVTNKHFAEEPLQYIIIRQPQNGWLEDKYDPEKTLLHFSQRQVDTGAIYYVHDGNDTNIDEFSIMAKHEGMKKHSNPHTVVMSIIAVNDQTPELTVNKRLEIYTGSTAPITNEHLLVTDKDTESQDLVYILNPPTNGYVALADMPRDNIVNFTQELINKNKIVYVHTGSEKGRFEFRVTDGDNVERSLTFQIIAKPLILTLRNEESLEVYPDQRQPLTPYHLLSSTNDPLQTRPIVYGLQTKPLFGVLVRLVNYTEQEIEESFTQEEINAGQIAYKHTYSIWVANQMDSFMYEITTENAQDITSKEFKISVSYTNINSDNYMNIIDVKTPVCDEGGEVIIDKQHLNLATLRKQLQGADVTLVSPEVYVVITRLPEHGRLVVDGFNASADGTTRFTHRDINRNKIIYYHDNSDTIWDQIKFQIDIESAGRENEARKTPSRWSIEYNITITAINDENLRVLNENPSIELVQGYVRNLTKIELNVVDPDTPPSGIVYHITFRPKFGFIASTDNLDEPADTFTQQDVNQNKIQYMHNGGRRSDAVWYSVSDGGPHPVSKVLNIDVSPLTLEVNEIRDLQLTQGYYSIYLDPKLIKVKTNGNLRRIVYNITTRPTCGELYMRDSVVHQFSHKNLEDGEVFYVQTDMNSHKDQFKFIMYEMQNYANDNTMNVVVRPLLKQPSDPIKAIPGKPILLTLRVLDATKLAELTGSNPIYNVTIPPKMGRLVKLVDGVSSSQTMRNKRGTKRGMRHKDPSRYSRDKQLRLGELRLLDPQELSVSSFSHQDIVDQIIKYKPAISNSSVKGMDSFQFLLTAPFAQSVPGELKFALEAPKRPATPVPTAGRGGGMKTNVPTAPATKAASEDEEGKKGTLGHDHLMVVFLVCGITALVVVVFIAIKCVKKRRRQKQQQLAQMKEDSRTPLSDPPPPYHMGGRDANGMQRTNSYDSEEEEESGSASDHSSGSPVHIAASDENMYRHPQVLYSAYTGRPTVSAPGTPGMTRSLGRSRSPQKSPTSSRTEISRAVPTCKVTPLHDGEEETEVKTPYGSLKRDQVTFDWDNVDPELLQHCRTTNPVLHKSKYWV